MTPVYDKSGIRLYHGDALTVLRTLPECSVDAVVTDPPYGLEFMGKEWDRLGWQRGGGFSKPGIGERKTEWVSFSPTSRFGAANQTCGTCGGRARGAKKCSCETPDWKPIGKRRNPENEGLPDDMTGAGYARALSSMQAWHYAWAVEALRILKPGGHLVAFGGTRTHHRLACAIEDAGFEIRDCLMYLYGSGFPKSLDVSRAIDKAGEWNADFDEVRAWLRARVISKGLTHAEIDRALGNENSHLTSHFLGNSQPMLPTFNQWVIIKQMLGVDEDIDLPPKCVGYERAIIGYRKVQPGVAFSSTGPRELPITLPATDASRQWSGWGTALKPGWEPIILARKPLSEPTVAANVLKWGTGGLNIDGCRIETGEALQGSQHASGRWPANVILDEEAGRLLDAQSGELVSGKPVGIKAGNNNKVFGQFAGGIPVTGYGDTGGASRFFYCPKASQGERNAGLDHGSFQAAGTHKASQNFHPTVKPIQLMRWLVRLVTPKGGHAVDCFMGSGTTGIACVFEDVIFLGIEQDASYVELATARIRHAQGPLFSATRGTKVP